MCKCVDSEAIFLLYYSAWQYGAGAQDSDEGDQCQMSAISSFSLSLRSLHAQTHMHALQHWLPLFPLASPSCLLLWPDEPSLFICYYTGIARSKNQEGVCGMCQHCWLKVHVYCHSYPLWPLLSFTLTPSIDQLLSEAKKQHNLSVCLYAACLNQQLTYFFFCLLQFCLALCPPLYTTASEGLSAVLMRISMFVLFICVSP